MPATPSVLQTIPPTIVPMPRSDLVTNVAITFTDISGKEVADAINVAAAISGVICRASRTKIRKYIGISILSYRVAVFSFAISIFIAT